MLCAASKIGMFESHIRLIGPQVPAAFDDTHGFGVNAVQSGVPLSLVQKWLGHAQLSTTAIYANAIGPEEYAIAERMW